MSRTASGRTSKIWRNGRLVDWKDATIHIMSHVVHYGSSVFEGLRCYSTPDGPSIFRLPDHVRRLLDSCRIHRIPMRHSPADLTQACLDTVAANGLSECYLRPVVVRTGEEMGVLGDDEAVETLIIAWRWGAYLGPEAQTHGVDVCVSSWRRPAPDTVPTLAKAGGNYQNSQLAKAEARANGYTEAILLDVHGYVSEGSGENLFLVRDRVVYTPPLAAGVLSGITRDSVITIAGDMGYQVEERMLPREALYTADELFLTGTAAEITPIRSVDRIPAVSAGIGDVTRSIQQAYLGIAKGELPDRYGWCSLVEENSAVAAPEGV